MNQIGVSTRDLLGSLEHDVGAFIGRALAVDADEETERSACCLAREESLCGHLDGEGDEGGLLREVRPVADIVFVEARDDAIAVVSDITVELALRCAEPVVAVLHGFSIGAQLVADIEVAIAQGTLVDALMHPVPVHAEGTQEHPLVVTAQVVVEEVEALGLQLEKHRIDELYDIVASQTGQQTIEACHEPNASPLAWTAGHIDIARIVLPEVAVGNDADLVAQRAQRLSEGGVDVAVFAYKQYSHLFSFWTTCMSRVMPREELVMRRNQVYLVV